MEFGGSSTTGGQADDFGDLKKNNNKQTAFTTRETSQVWANRDQTVAEGPLTREQEDDRIFGIAQEIGGKGELRDMTVRPNCADIYEIVEELNKNAEYTGPAPGTFGTLYRDGTIAFIKKNGQYSCVGPGRYRLMNPFAEWTGTMHVGAGFTHETVGTCHVVRVPNGQYALCWMGTRPFILTGEGGGYFAINSEHFMFDRFVKITQPTIDHGTYHIVRVPQGKVACVTESGLPYLLPYGVHIFDSLTFKFSAFAGLEQEHIKHGTLTRFIVKAGCLGLAWEEKVQPLFFNEPGVYFVDSAMFEYVGNVDISEKEIHLGSRKIITVHEGEVGISHKNGELYVLEPGRHVIDDAGHLFDEFLSTQQQGLSLEREDQRDSMMICETRELVKVGVQAYVFYNIARPKLAVVKIGTRKNIERLINETATAVITTIIRSTGLAEISQGGKKDNGPKVKSEKDLEEKDDFEPNLPFFDQMKVEFLDRLQNSFVNDYGINMLNIRIGDFKVLEREIAASIAKHALITAETQANLANLEGRRQIDLVNKDSDARIEKMTADVEAHRVITSNKAKAQAIRDKAAAQAQSRKVEAEAKARAVTIKAQAAEAEASAKQKQAEARAHTIQTLGEAEAKATRMRGEAEAKRAEKLGATELGREEALAAINADMVSGAMKGLSKVVYMPTELQRNPFAFFNGQDAAFPLTKAGLTQ